MVKFIFLLGLKLNRAVKADKGDILVEGGFPPMEPRERDILMEGEDDEILRSLACRGKSCILPVTPPIPLRSCSMTVPAFLSDAANSFPRWVGTRYCCFYITDMAANYRSWRKILDAGVRTTYPAHGKPFPAEKLHSNLDHYSQAMNCYAFLMVE